MGTTNLHQLLRSLCFNTHWNYAIFWKLKHRARMMLTWEDAYYDSPDDYNALGCAVAKMSYHVYSLGEGIVGQVAATGKHRWICSDNQVFEFADGWQSQFSAGIRTIVVVAVVPLGVVQLGSPYNVTEEMGVVTHIKNLFWSTQDYSIGHDPSKKPSNLKNYPSLPDVSKKNLSSDVMPSENVLMPLQCFGKNYGPHSAYEEMTDNVVRHKGPEFYSDESSILLQSISNMMNLEHQELEEMRPLNRRKCEGGSGDCNNLKSESEKNVSSFLHNSVTNNNSFNDLIRPSEKARVDSACYPSVFLDAFVSENDKLHYVDINQHGVLNSTGPSDSNSQKHAERSKFQTDPCDTDSSYTLLKFPAGCELHEALGPDFLQGSKYFDWAAQVNQDVKTVDIPDEVGCSQLTSESRPEHLLEAMVANICHSNSDVKSELSFCTSMQSAMASGKNPEASVHNVHTSNSDGCSIYQSSLVSEDKHHCLSSSSGIGGVMSPKVFSSTCPSSNSGLYERSSEPAKNSKKRARTGESCRPRPRDRQLIQDRIKELRELVPAGAKCSIDSLLERTIKHMLFLQSITKHADKLTRFDDTKSKLNHMETDALGSSNYDQGSSWAMEVGGHLKVHSILVKNLSKNEQMLVEMLCEECSHFLEIAEAIKGLGLTILKGATKPHGEKIWLCFVVEGQNNRHVHRLDILWPLVQILQSKNSVFTIPG